MPYECDGGDNNPVVVIITDQIEAETTAWCQEHFPLFIRTMYDAMFPAPETPAKPAKRAAKGKRSAVAESHESVAASPVPDAETDDETDEDGAADANPDYAGGEPGSEPAEPAAASA